MKSNSKIWTIIKHEYKSKIKSKGFIISTILGPVILLAFIAASVLVSVFTAKDTSRALAVLDRTNIQIAEKLISIDPKFYSKPKTIHEDSLRNQILEEQIDGYLIIPSDFLEKGTATIYSKGGGGWGYIERLEKHLNNILRKERLLATGTSPEVIKIIEDVAVINTQKITKKGTEKDYTTIYAAIGYVLGFFIYMLMLMYGQFVSRGVIEEKANRIIEVIASSVRPFQILLGKVFGIGMLGLTQVVFWTTLSLLLLWLAGPIISLFQPEPQTMTQGMGVDVSFQESILAEIPDIPIGIIIAFIFYFLVGYFMYATIFAAIGSAVDQESDAAQLQSPVIFAIVIPMLFMPAITSNPDSTLASILSLIPFFTPILMTVRIAATSVPLWEIILSGVLSVGFVFLLLWIASKIYRVGILMYGKKPKLKDLIKWIRLAK